MATSAETFLARDQAEQTALKALRPLESMNRATSRR